MALEKIIGVAAGIGLSLFLAGKALSQTIEYITDSTGTTKMVVDYGNYSYDINSKKFSLKTNQNPSMTYDANGNLKNIKKDAREMSYMIDPKNVKINEKLIIL